MDDVGVVEAAEDVYDGVGFTDVGEEFVAEAFALAGALDESGDVDDFHGGGDDVGGLHELDEAVEALVGYSDDADVGLYGAEGKVSRLCFGVAKAVKKCRFSHVGESDYSAL